MPSNLLKRTFGYYWRRSVVIERQPISLTLSLRTKAPAVGKRRCALMTAKSEDVRMTLYARVAAEGLSPDQRGAIFRAEMIAYRNALDHEVVRWETAPELNDLCSSASSLKIFREFWGEIAESGGAAGLDGIEQLRHRLPALNPEEVRGLATALAALPAFDAALEKETRDRLTREGVRASPLNLPLAMRVIAAARAQAAHERLEHIVPSLAQMIPAPAPGTVIMPSPPAPTSSGCEVEVATTPAKPPCPPEWANKTAHDIAQFIIATKPNLFDHRAGGKRASAQSGEQTKRQLKWAAVLFDKAIGRPFWTRTRDDIVVIDRWFERLPVTIGKSPAHHRSDVTLEMIEAEALERIEAGELSAADIGFSVGNANKHYRFLAQINRELIEHAPGLPAVNFTEFCTPDIKDERDARLRISNEQAEMIFRLPPWQGCAGIDRRLDPGSSILHDGLYWVLLLVWYSGARREEICKLMVDDVDQHNGTWFIRIRATEAGRVKNLSAVRIVAICEELVRLGFVEFVLAMKVAGEKLLFPELMPGGQTKRKLGDVFYKLWWIYIAPLVEPKLARGQAMHACRHAVDDELKQAEIFLETRNDLLGWKGKGGEGETRYPSPTALAKLKSVVDLIPIVTGHLPSISATGIRLLPADRRVSRPTRSKAEATQ